MRRDLQRGTGLSVRDLSYAYGRQKALDQVCFTVEPGRLTALLGPNGAGKSTLIALLSHLFVADSGRIEIFGLDLAARPRDALALMGIVFQQQTLDLDLTVAQNMRYFAALQGMQGRRAETRIAACLERLGLAERRGQRVRTLSGGLRRRLEIARSLLHEPACLLLDEPTVGLDVAARGAIVEHVHALAVDDGLTVLWATHLVDEVRPGDDLVVLHRGEVQAAGPVSAVLEAAGTESILAAYQVLTGRGDDER